MKLKLFLIGILGYCLGFQGLAQQDALSFDGVDDKVVIADNPSFNNTQTLTVEAWIKADAWDNDEWQANIAGKEGSGSGWRLRAGNNGSLRFGVGYGSWAEVFSGAIMQTNTWYHVAGVLDSGMMYVYINGNLEASASAPSMTSSSDSLFIGASPEFPDRFFEGAIDEVRVWNVARTQSEILNNNTRELTGTESGLVAYYDFNLTAAISGDTVYNRTPVAGIDGVLKNFNIASVGGILANYTDGYSPPGYCPAFTNFSIENVTQTTAELNWTPGDSSSSYYLEYGVTGFTPGTGNVITGNLGTDGPPEMLTGLSAQTAYDIYFGEVCNSGNDSTYFLSPKTFTTACSASLLPYSEAFDTHPFSCMDTTGGSRFWKMYSGSGGDNYAHAHVNNSPYGTFYLTTPPIALDGPAQLEFKWSHRYSAYYDDILKVQIEINNSGTWNDVHVLSNALGNFESPNAASSAPGDFVQETVYLDSSLAGDTVRIRFITGTSDFGFSVFLDDLEVKRIPDCPMPLDFDVKTTGSYHAIISIDGIAGSYDIEYGQRGFAKGSGTVVTRGKEAVLRGLSPDTEYQAFFRTNCTSAGNGYGPWMGILSFRTTCAEVSLPYSEDFDTYPFNCMDTLGGTRFWSQYGDTSGNTYAMATTRSSPYGKYYLTTRPVLLNNPAQVRFEWSHGYTSGNSDELRVEMEVNGSGEWDSLIVLKNEYGNFNSAGATYNSPGKFIEELIYLDSALVGDTIRVRFITGQPTSGYPVFMDNVHIEEIPACPGPRGFILDSVTVDKAWISFNAQTSDFEYEIGYTGYTQGTGTRGTGGNPVVIDSLEDGQRYDVYVRADCSSSNEGTSDWAGPFTFATKCLETSMPYYEGFDYHPFLCLDTTGGTRYWSLYNENGQSFAEATVSSFPKGDYFLTTQPIVIDKPAQVRFEWSHRYYSYYDDEMRVEYEVNESGQWDSLIVLKNEYGNFEVPGGSYNSPGDFREEIVYLDSALVGDTVKIRFVALSNSSSHIYLNDLFVEEIPSCPDPRDVVVESLGSDFVSFSMDSTTGELIYEYGPSGFSIGNGVRDSAQNPFEIPGLDPQTSYDVYIRSACSSIMDSLSEWTGPFTFMTKCAETNMPYYESFDTWPLVCMENLGIKGWTDQTDSVGGYMATALLDDPPYGRDYLTTQPVVIDEMAWVRFKWSHKYTFHHRDTLKVEVESNNSGVWNTIMIRTNAEGDFGDPGAGESSPGDFTEETIYLEPSLIGDTVRVRFTASSWSSGNRVFLDDLYIEALPDCPKPGQVNIISTGPTTAIIPFQFVTDSFDYEFDTTGFVLGSGQRGSGGHPVSLSGLSQGQTYDVYIRANCTSSGNDTSDWAGPFTFTQKCMQVSMPFHESFDVWPLSCMDTTGGRRTWKMAQGNSGDNYAFAELNMAPHGSYHLTTPSILLDKPAQVRFEWSHDSASYDDYLRVEYQVNGSGSWENLLLLHNDSGNFDDPGATFNGAGNFTQEILYLDSALVGSAVKVRFVTGHPSYGYHVYFNDLHVEERGKCLEPSALKASDLKVNSISIYPEGSGGVYELEYGIEGFTRGNGTLVSSGEDTATVDMLTSETCYDFYVRNNCATDTSDWIGPFTFCTAIECPDAGEGRSVSLCDTIPDIDLNDYLTDPDSGGVWIDVAATGALNGNIFDATHQNIYFGSTYDFWYVVEKEDCVSDTATVSVKVDSCNTAIGENILENSLKVYPNPTSESVQMYFETRSSEDIRIEISGISGKEIIGIDRRNTNGTFRERVDLSHLSKGIYFLKVSCGTMKTVRKIIRE